MSVPFFSVVVPAYNAGHYLFLALQSVVEQTFDDWELIVVDDGSRAEEAVLIEDAVQRARTLLTTPRGSDNRVLDAAQAAEKIRFFRQENQGVSSARNFGMSQARAPWIAFLDNDDLWKPLMMERVHRLFCEKPDTVLVHTRFEVIDGEGHYVSAGHARPVTYLSYLSGENPGLPCNSVFSKEIVLRVGGYDPLYPLGQDFDLCLKIYHRYESRIEFVAEHLACYRVHLKNASRNYSSNQLENTHILTKHLLLGQYLQKPEVERAARRGIQSMNGPYGVAAYECARTEVRNRQPRAFLTHFAYALRRNPSYVLRQLTRYFKRQ